MLTILLVFISVFLFVFSFFAGAFKPKVDVRKRMDNYLSKVTAGISVPSSAAGQSQEGVSSGEAVKHLRDIVAKYGRKIERHGRMERIELELQRADLPLRGYEFIFLVVGVALVAILAVFIWNHNIISMAVAGLLGFLAPIMFLKMKQQQRLHKFNGQIGDALVLISNSLKAGYGFMQAVEMVAKEMTPPIRTEFSRVMQEINLGTTTEEALVHMTWRINSGDMDLVVTAMLIQRQSGGNLSEILDNISHTIRERVRIAGEVKTLTAQGRLSGLIIGALPLGLGALLLVINPKYMLDLFTDPRGQLMIGYAVVAELIAIVIIKKIVTIKV
jgi:tight adherence protein B